MVENIVVYPFTFEMLMNTRGHTHRCFPFNNKQMISTIEIGSPRVQELRLVKGPRHYSQDK
jgi:hypothetical protein